MKKRILSIAIPAVIAVVAIFLVVTKVVIPNSNYNAAVELMNSGEYEQAIAAFEALGGYKDSANKIEECNIDIDYNAALELMEAGKYEEAYEAFIALGDYKDSAEKAKSIYEQSIQVRLKTAEVGDVVVFGTYEQDDDRSNGKEDIEWQVLAKEDNRVLVISKYALDCQPYNTSHEDVTWESCTLRTLLNEIFLNAAFSTEEQAAIAETKVTADKNPNFDTDPGNDTTDKVFLLSIDEANEYFASDSARMCAPTDYAQWRGAWTNDSYKTASGEATCSWWLRSPCDRQDIAADVGNDGSVHFYFGSFVDLDDAVRPALWINLES